MFEWMSKAVEERRGRYAFTCHPAASEADVAEVERRLGVRLPAALRHFLLAFHDGGILFHEEADPFSSVSFHLFGTPAHAPHDGSDLVSQTLDFRETYEEQADGLVVFGYTPGPGAFYLGLDLTTGAVLDLFGYKRKDWPVIAPDLEALLQRMFSDPERPLFWL